MKKRFNVLGRTLTLLLAMLLTSSCSSADDGEQLDGFTVSNFPVLDGSDSTTPLRYILLCHALGYTYQWIRSPFVQYDGPKSVYPDYTCTWEEEHHLRVDCMKKSNTHQSFLNLIDNSVELILTARTLSRDEKDYAEKKNVSLIEKPIAIDALAFIVNPDNPVDNLTTAQIQGIYTGEIKNWKEVGGKDAPIVAYIRNRNSGSQEKFETMVMNGLQIADLPEFQIGTTMIAPYDQLERDKNGIAFTPFYYFNTIVDNDHTKVVGIDGIPMTKQNIQNNTYPYITEVYAEVRSDIDKNSMAYKLFEYLTTSGGQDIVKESGYVSLNDVSFVNKVKAADTRIVCSGHTVNVQSPYTVKLIELYGMDGKLAFKTTAPSKIVQMPAGLNGVFFVKVYFDNGLVYKEKAQLH